MAESEVPEPSWEVAQAMVLTYATQEGRCPHCGRRNDAEEGKLFDTLRSELADARTERDEAQAQNRELEEERNLLFAQLREAQSRVEE